MCYTTGKVPLAGAVRRAAADGRFSPKRTEKGNAARHQSYTLAHHCGSRIVATVNAFVTFIYKWIPMSFSRGRKHRLAKLENSQSKVEMLLGLYFSGLHGPILARFSCPVPMLQELLVSIRAPVVPGVFAEAG